MYKNPPPCVICVFLFCNLAIPVPGKEGKEDFKKGLDKRRVLFYNTIKAMMRRSSFPLPERERAVGASPGGKGSEGRRGAAEKRGGVPSQNPPPLPRKRKQ